jgi:hypothetical protein
MIQASPMPISSLSLLAVSSVSVRDLARPECFAGTSQPSMDGEIDTISSARPPHRASRARGVAFRRRAPTTRTTAGASRPRPRGVEHSRFNQLDDDWLTL